MILKHAYHVWFILSIYIIYISIHPITLPLTANVRSTRFLAVFILFPTFCCSSVALPYEILFLYPPYPLYTQLTWHPILEETVLKAVYFTLDIFLQFSFNALQVCGFIIEVAGSETQKRNFKLNRSSQYRKILL